MQLPASQQVTRHDRKARRLVAPTVYCVKLLPHVLILRAHSLFPTAFNSAIIAIPLPGVYPSPRGLTRRGVPTTITSPTCSGVCKPRGPVNVHRPLHTCPRVKRTTSTIINTQVSKPRFRACDRFLVAATRCPRWSSRGPARRAWTTQLRRRTTAPLRSS
jgi:hypothetical protein